MPHTLDQILPSLEALGIWSYWIIGLAAMLEAVFATGIVVPGTLVVDAGGILVQQGAIDFFDLAWFVAIGSILGGEISYWAGVWARRGINTRWNPETSPSYRKAERLFARYGGLALVLGRFAGPVSGLVPFAAAVSQMDRRRFVIWNIASGFPYALAHVAFGYFLGDLITRLGPLATRVALLAGALLVALAVLWWLVVRVERMLPFVLSILRSIAHAVATNPEVAGWSARHPGLAGFISQRLDPSRASGLTATLLGAAILYVLFVWAGSALDFLMAEPIVQADTRLANLIHAFWTPAVLRVAAHVTALGDGRVVVALMAAALSLLWLRRRPDLMLGLTAAVVGNVATVLVLKRAFQRPRPEIAYFVETTGSFPSGHAAISVSFYAMLFFIAWRVRLLGPILAALLAATLAFLIGLSRLYLIEHYLTDILNGWLVGALWLLIGIAFAEWWRETRAVAVTAAPPALRAAGIGLAAALSLFAVWQVATYDKARNIPLAPPPDRVVADIAAFTASGEMPTATETIVGTPLEPVNVILLARDSASLESAMVKAGWQRAAKPTLGSLARSGWALLTALEDDTAPLAPQFWRGQPNDIAFEKPVATPPASGPATGTARVPAGAPAAGLAFGRHNVRLWRTPFVTADGLRIFVGAAGGDKGIGGWLQRQVAPDIDRRRDLLAADLEAAGVVAARRTLALPPAAPGGPAARDSWISDGRAAVLTLR